MSIHQRRNHRELRKYIEINEYENSTYQNLFDTAKTVEGNL